jgi:hypothetical protein
MDFPSLEEALILTEPVVAGLLSQPDPVEAP